MDGVLNTTSGSAVDAPCTGTELSETLTALSADNPSVDGVLL